MTARTGGSSSVYRLLVVAVSLAVAVLALGAVAAPAAADDGPYASSPPASPGCADGETHLYGDVLYRYEPYSSEPPYQGLYHPARGVEVEIVQQVNATTNVTLAEVPTKGDASFSACVEPVTAENGSDSFEVAVYFETKSRSSVIKPAESFFTASPRRIQSESPNFTIIGESQRLGRPYPGGEEIALLPSRNHTVFHIANRLDTAWEFFRQNTPNRLNRSAVTVIYPDLASLYGNGDVISIADRPYPRSSIAVFHEYGHALMATAYQGISNTPVGGKDFELRNDCHTFPTESNKPFALREAWAEFFQSVLYQTINDRATYYNSSNAQGCPPSDADGTMDGYRVEGAIAGALWDVYDDSPEEELLNESFATIYTTLNRTEPNSAWELHEGLRKRVENKTALDRIFARHGMDVIAPDLTVDGGQSPAIYGPNGTISGSIVDEHSNITRVQVSVDGGPWQTVAGDDATEWSTTVSNTTDSVTVRATDHWGNNATATVSIEVADVPIVVEKPITDPNDDGVYEDITGDGSADVFDALAYYNHRSDAVVQSNPELFDYDGEGGPGTVFDALALYNSL